MFANMKVRQDGELALIELDAQSARHIAKELLHLADEAEDRASSQQSVVLGVGDQYGSKISHFTVRPTKDNDHHVDDVDFDNAIHRNSRYGRDKIRQG